MSPRTSVRELAPPNFLIPVLSPLSLSPPPFFPTAGSVVDAPVFDNVFAVVAM